MLRATTVSTQNSDVECGLMRALLGQLGTDGLVYSPLSNDGAPSGTAYPIANGLLALAMLTVGNDHYAGYDDLVPAGVAGGRDFSAPAKPGGLVERVIRAARPNTNNSSH
jgi:hypothetical protein